AAYTRSGSARRRAARRCGLGGTGRRRGRTGWRRRPFETRRRQRSAAGAEAGIALPIARGGTDAERSEAGGRGADAWSAGWHWETDSLLGQGPGQAEATQHPRPSGAWTQPHSAGAALLRPLLLQPAHHIEGQ